MRMLINYYYLLKKVMRGVPNKFVWAVILIMLICFLLQIVVGFERSITFAMKPRLILESLNSIREGNIAPGDLFAPFTVVTAMFLHGGFGHLGSNMLIFWVIATLLAKHVNRRHILIVFFVGGFIGNFAQFYVQPAEVIPVLGASGCVSALMGMYFILLIRWDMGYPYVWPLARPVHPMALFVYILIGLGMDIFGYYSNSPGVAYAAHIGGFFTGMFAAFCISLIYPSEKIYWEKWLKRPMTED